MQNPIDWLTHFMKQDTRDLPGYQAALVMLLRGVAALVRDISQGQLTLRAMSLSFTTLLSLVPLLALSFSVLKGFGVHNSLQPLLLQTLEPLGAQGVEISEKIIAFVNNMNVGVLGSVGLGLLLYTVVSLIQKIEDSFNHIWGVKDSRGLAERFRDYLSVVLVGPIVMVSAIGLSASMKSSAVMQSLLEIEGVGVIILTAMKFIPFFLIILAFTFLYSFMPNTKVKLLPAFIGALIAGFLWQTASWGFASFVVSSTKYTAIYSSFAILIIFLIWINLNWLLVLIGADISYYIQHPEYLLRGREENRVSNISNELLGFQVMYSIARRFELGEEPDSIEGITDRLYIPQKYVHDVVMALVDKGLLIKVAGDSNAYVPAKALDAISLAEIYIATRQQGEVLRVAPYCDPMVNNLMVTMADASDAALQEKTLKALVAPGS